MRRVLTPLALALTLSLACGGAWYGLHYIPVDFLYGIEAEFDEVPPTDAALEQWLQAQPGVWRAGVERQPTEGRWRLVLTLGMTQNGWYEPHIPDLSGKCAELGYRGQHGPFRDQRR